MDEAPPHIMKDEGLPVSLTPDPLMGQLAIRLGHQKNGGQVAGYPRGRGEVRESLARLSR